MNNNLELEKEELYKKDYEVSFLLASEENVKDVLRLLGQHGADIGVKGEPGKVILAYEINHRKEAYFGFYQVKAAPREIKVIEQDLKMTPGVLRSLVVFLPRDSTVRRLESRPRIIKPQTKKEDAELKSAPAPRERVLSNEALEKKIEEILQ